MIVSLFSMPLLAQYNSIVEDTIIVRSIKVIGNNRTSDKIIRRELNFVEGDSIASNNISSIIEKSKENLQNTSLFNSTNIYYTIIAGKFVDFTVTLEERWYFWPSFYFNHTERNFNTWWEEKDLSKLSIGAGFKIKNMRGRNENFKFNSRFGYSTRFEFAYDKIALDKARKHHLGIYYSFQVQDQLPYITRDNRPIFIKDRSEKLLFFQETNFKYYYRPKHKIKHHAELKYFNIEIADTIANINSNYLLDSNLNLKFFRFMYFFEYENRDFVYYPMNGQYLSFELMKNGLNFISNNKYNDYSISVVLIHHKKINNYISLASGVFSCYSPNTPKPYAFRRGLGYKKSLRGFEYYTIEGHANVLSQNQAKFTLIQPQTFNMKFIPSPKFSKGFFAAYINVFTDVAYVWSNKYLAIENNNTLANNLIYSYGIGIDFVSYYDKVMRVDFVKNSLGEYGVFINFKASVHKP